MSTTALESLYNVSAADTVPVTGLELFYNLTASEFYGASAVSSLYGVIITGDGIGVVIDNDFDVTEFDGVEVPVMSISLWIDKDRGASATVSIPGSEYIDEINTRKDEEFFIYQRFMMSDGSLTDPTLAYGPLPVSDVNSSAGARSAVMRMNGNSSITNPPQENHRVLDSIIGYNETQEGKLTVQVPSSYFALPGWTVEFTDDTGTQVVFTVQKLTTNITPKGATTTFHEEE